MASVGSDRSTTARASDVRISVRIAMHVLLPLAIGCAVYFFWRGSPPIVGMIRRELGLGAARAPGWLPRWFDAQLPDAAWTYALVSTARLLWREGPRFSRVVWTCIASALAIGWELGQRWGWVPGGYSTADLVATIAAAGLAVVLVVPSSPSRSFTGSKNIQPPRPIESGDLPCELS